jgi:TonB family protein
MPSLGRAAGRAILGLQPITGRLPISLPGLHPRGTGLNLNYPRAISLPKPPFPPAARAVRAFGDVLVEVLIDENGEVASAEAVNGHALLKRNAEAAAKLARFEVNSDRDSRRVVLIYRYIESDKSSVSPIDTYPYVIPVIPDSIRIHTLRSNS